ncbi:hypothetical protein [Hymenobacter rigui]|uniref:Uncharacterized protein n=1 Tax=Hymenobacter rigui TaxID=334424 RepID=A0A428KF75_9BACT|nr:hypothetical protein [Hymenobacter rigui]RSK45028.1 hypothetical protein EI291_19515 [Hymenobacter rigui]
MVDVAHLFGVLLLLVLVAGLAMVAFTCGYCAYTHGRSFWLWFALGMVLPILTYFVLFALILQQEMNQGQRLLREARAILAAAEKAAHEENH